MACAGALCAAEGGSRNPRLTGTPFMQVWQTEDFGASPVNWRVLQHPNGFIYVGNNFGVLEFDGATWRSLPMPREGAVRALVVDTRGQLWAAGNGEIGRMEIDARGVSRLTDETLRLPVSERVFGVLNRAVATRDGVYFSGERQVFLFRHDGAIHTWRTELDFSPTWAIDEQVHVARDERELVRLRADGGTDVLATFSDLNHPLLHTYAAARVEGQRVLLTREGPMRWREGGTTVEPLSAGSRALFQPTRGRAASFLRDGQMIVGTVRGALLFDRQGQFVQRFDTSHGLPVDTVNAFGEDRDGGVWIALQNGIARLHLDSPFALHGRPQGLESGPRRMARWQDRLYVAHGSGVSWRDAAGRFHSVASLGGGANRPVIVDDRLLVSTPTGIKEISRDGQVHAWNRSSAIALMESRRHPGWLFSGDADGLWLVAPTAAVGAGRPGWRVEGRLATLPVNVVQLHDSGDGYLWIVGTNADIWRIDFRAGLRLDAPSERYDAERGVPPALRRDHVQMFALGDDTIAAGAKWLLRFDPARGRFEPAAAELGGITNADAFDVSSADEAWLHGGAPASRVFRLTRSPATGASQQGAKWRVEAFDASSLDRLTLNSIFHEAKTRTLWLAGQGSLVSMDLDWRRQHAAPTLQARVRQIRTRQGDVVFGGGGRPAGELKLAAEQNALRFEFAAPTFAPDYQGRIRVQYRTRIDGLERDWTPWSAETYRDVTNLPYRQLALRVQARTPDGRLSAEDIFSLSVTAPWWLAPWAFGGYALLAAGGVTGVVWLRTRTLRRRADRLEKIVVARTAELAEKNTTLAAQNTELVQLRHLETQEKIAARLAEEKARLEVLRYQLNPHFLFNALTSICAQLPAAGGARTTIERLTDFCQLTLFRPEGDENPTLGDELAMLRAYLDIEQTRWGELLTVVIECDPALEKIRLPALLLLPLVENALKYGRATNLGAMTIRIAVQRELSAAPGAAGAIVLTVANTGEWVEGSARGSIASLGIGLENLRERLRRHYPGAHAFTTEAKNGWVVVRLRLEESRARTTDARLEMSHVI